MPGEWYEGIVVASSGRSARIKIADELFELTPEGFAWTRRTRPDELLKRGDVAWFRLKPAAEDGREPILVLEQEPEMEGAVVVLESSTGAVRAMVGGWDYRRSEFNRVTQTRRQAGSAFKLFVYGAALENGFTAADALFDGPVALRGADAGESYSPRNDSRRYYGVVTLRRALEQSINVTSVKLLDVVGVERVIDLPGAAASRPICHHIRRWLWDRPASARSSSPPPTRRSPIRGFTSSPTSWKR